MKIVLEASDKVMLKLLKELRLKLKRNGIKYSEVIEPVKRKRKQKPIEPSPIVEQENIIEDEKKDIKKSPQRAKRKARN